MEQPSLILEQASCSCEHGTYGKRGNVAANACGAIAAYNACALLGRPVSFQEALLVLGSSALRRGRMGTNPFALLRFLKAKGLHPRRARLSGAAAEGIYIALYLFSNQRRLSGHYIALRRDKQGFMAYNDSHDGSLHAYASLRELKSAHKAFALWAWKVD